ncbi:hypothetical protein FHS27_004869 [Rhodopirellula rubra]|uniref:DUF4159 domain-containing protein n=1 Tax=Aporhodopirellula rubra TaxID=980271 RepID=A0A7W5H831_9BACT|nr:DUF4159 domain-containing protein [Aporhodopirellula rubra]MBB3209033.1 hypothetical protein [Aporhodopirellula rubra]
MFKTNPMEWAMVTKTHKLEPPGLDQSPTKAGWAGKPIMRCLIILLLLVAQSTPSRAEIDAITVQRSIDRGIEYLRKSQNERGGWEEYGGQSCGLSALCTLAWVNAGVSRQDPDLIRAIEYLRTFEPQQTYSISLQTLVFCAVGALEDLPRIRRNVAWLAEQQKGPNDRNKGAWTYGNGRGNGDPSNAQFAVLALGAAAERGIEVDPKVFQAAADYWRRIQLRRGGWSYGGPRPSGSMTCAGIASLLICGSSLNDLDDTKNGERLNCCGGGESDEALERGLDFLSDIFSIQANPGGELLSYYYYLYAVERVGRLSGRRLIGNRDWYREGAERLVSLQDAFQGFWKGGGVVESNRDIATSFALLFLSKGKRQVVVGRLDHPSLRSESEQRRGNVIVRVGNEVKTETLPHSGALRELVRHVERDWSKDLTWQTIVADQATTQDLLKAPVLVITGSSTLNFNAALRENLKQYLDQGGTILFDSLSGDGCGDGKAFERSVVSLCSEWFPKSKLERLPTSHPVWFAEAPVDPAAIANDYWVYGVGACCRTPVFYSPRSLTCRWSRGGPLLRGVDLPPKIGREVVAGITIGENILAYATGRELKDKLDGSGVIVAGDAPQPTRGAIPIASGALGAGEEQVQRALPNAALIIREKLTVEVIAVDEPIALTEQSLRRIGVLYLTGQTEFELDDVSRAALKNYIDREGIVIASPICGSEAFASSVRRELAALVPQGEFTAMPSDHPAWTTRFGGFDLTNVEIRVPNQKRAGDQSLVVAQRSGSPVMESIQVNGVDTIFYSPLDLSCALESQNSIQCPGYPTADAAKIIAGVILYALQQ